MDSFFQDFQEYMFASMALRSATGICVGMVTKECIEKIFHVTLKPMLSWMYGAGSSSLFSVLGRGHFMEQVATTLGTVVGALIDWWVFVIVVFVILEYFLNRTVIGLSTSVPDKKKTDLANSRQKAMDTSLIGAVNKPSTFATEVDEQGPNLSFSLLSASGQA